MARLHFHCIDENGNYIIFETSEHEGKDLVNSYQGYVKFLIDNKFTPIKPPNGKSARPIVKFDGKICPQCGEKVWDNRERILIGEFNQKSPHFACSNKGKCKFAVWRGQYEIITNQ